MKAVPKVVVLRWGHRPRDARLTTHVALAARAFGASGMIVSDVKDESIQRSMRKVVETWGGPFNLQVGPSWKASISEWKAKDGLVVHLTVYGENIQKSNVIRRIRAANKDVLVIVGSQKVPSEFFSHKLADFNVAVGNQPHSECSSLAVFLDRFFEGKELEKEFEKGKLQIIPQKHGKKVIQKTASS